MFGVDLSFATQVEAFPLHGHPLVDHFAYLLEVLALVHRNDVVAAIALAGVVEVHLAFEVRCRLAVRAVH